MPETEKPKYKRKILIIKRALQTKYVALVFLSVLIASAMVAWHIHYEFNELMLTASPEQLDFIKSIKAGILIRLWIYTVIMVVVAVYISHKFAGPVFRMEKSCETVAQGDLTCRAFLRKGDELFELKDEFNRMMDFIHSHISKDNASAQRIAQELGTLASSGQPSSQKLLELKKELEKINSSFKI